MYISIDNIDDKIAKDEKKCDKLMCINTYIATNSNLCFNQIYSL